MRPVIPSAYEGGEQAFEIGLGAGGSVTFNYVDAFAGFWANDDGTHRRGQD